MRIRELSVEAARIPRPVEEGWRSFGSHTHMMRGDLRPPESLRNLVSWCKGNGIHALGVGSPWTPADEESYERYEGRDRVLYYSGAVDQRGLRQERDVEALLDRLNDRAGGSTLFFLDNETPKGRYGHLWWLGWSHDFPAWHDYDQPFDRWMVDMRPPGHFHAEPMPYQRRPYLEILGAQRSRGALGIWAHPTSWWWSPQHTFVTNIASELPFHLLAEAGVDGMVIMGYRAWQQSCLDLWFHFLDLGYRVPGFAEMDIGLSNEGDLGVPYLNWYRSSRGTVDSQEIIRAGRSGRIVASSGPFIDVTLDGEPMGSCSTSGRGRSHLLSISAAVPQEVPCRVALYSTRGQAVWERRGFSGGTISLGLDGVDARTYLVCCLIEEKACVDAAVLPQARSVAIANPVWLDPNPGVPPVPVNTELDISCRHHSPWRGGRILCESPTGALLDEWDIRSETLHARLPAASRVTLESVDGYRETRFLLNANPRVQRMQQYLYRGQFLEDFPETRPGEVPLKAFSLDEYREALASLQWEL